MNPEPARLEPSERDAQHERDVQVDLRRVIAAKSPALLRLIPRPALRYLERIVHVDGLNHVLRELEHLEGVAFARGGLTCLGARFEARFAERLDAVDRPIVVGNHPLGGLDGLALLVAVSEHKPHVVLPGNDLLMHLPQLQPVLLPVNKHGSNRAIRDRFEAAFAGDSAVVHFPAGLCSRKKGRLIRDLAWQKSFVVRARRYERPVVPVYIQGRNSEFFYNLARLRRWSGLRFNAEMIYLVDEMFKQRDRTIRLTFGKAVPPQKLSRGDASSAADDWEVANALRRHVYRLAHEPDREFP